MTDTATAISITGSPSPTAEAPPTMTVDQARARREQIITGDERQNYLAGDVAIRGEMRQLNMVISGADTGDRLEAVLTGQAVASNRIETTTDTDFLTTRDLASAVKGLRQWYPDDVIREIASGVAVTPERHREAELARERILRDREFMAGLRAGHSEKVQLIKNIVAVLAAPVEG